VSNFKHEDAEFAEDLKRKKVWIQTYSGKKFYPLQPKVGDLDFIDQAHALAHTCRFGGHVSQHYSVAEHAWWMSYVAEKRGYSEEIKKWCLIHDNAEAYLGGDMTRPVKVQPELESFRDAEKHLGSMIAIWLGLPGEEPKVVRDLDTEILGTEARRFKSPVHPDWEAYLPPLMPDIIPARMGLEPAEARYRYLWRFKALWGDKAAQLIAPRLHEYMSAPP
jgi:hypothetical protein